jgi:tetratricopeptide (TPR) repeat protein
VTAHRARRAARALAVASLAAVAPGSSEARAPARPAAIVSYSFDGDVATGPDTFAVWQGARHAKGGRGRVGYSSAFHVSGHRSVELRDVPGDGDFPELQGYFPVRATGRLYFHFAFLTTDPKQELNVALAGPRYFQVAKDGIGFWLGTKDGQLVHYSDSIPKRLFVPQAFVWYAVDVAYDLDAGRYDLVIRAEGRDEPLVSLRGQANTPSQPGSAIDKFSFVGSPYTDDSRVVYYVDDVVIGSDASVAALPFVAPGRRRLFVDSFAEYQRLLRERPRCLPATDPEDLGFEPDDVAALAAAGYSESLMLLLAAGGAAPPVAMPDEHGPERWQGLLRAAAAWSAGCASLDAGDAAGALERFSAARETAHGARIIVLSQALALTALGRTEAADERLSLLSEWRHDARYAVASAYVGLARKDLETALAWLRDPAAAALDRDAPPGGEEPVTGRVAEQYYYVLLWKGEWDDARDYALRMAERAARARAPGAAWSARAADASFFRNDLADARELYESALSREKDWGALREIYLKLADLAYLAGDTERERSLREHYYGSLSE